MSSGTPDVDPWLGKTIDGRYVLRRRIGRGGMGVVYEADHAALDRRVAIKLISAAEAPDAYLVRFRREAKLASRITHEHVVHIYDVGIDADTNADYIVMELVEGRDLGRELEAGKLSIARTVTIARQLLRGLQAIHEGGIIHRDIKPANVMLATRPEMPDFVKLMDFGIARALGDASLTVTGRVVGTPSFMSPEQLRGQTVDHRSDLYAVGVTLFVMLAGRLPFEGNTAVLAGQHVFSTPPSIAEFRPDAPPALIAAVDRALAKAPEDRFPDALAFAAALEAEAPASAPPPTETVAMRGDARGARSRIGLLAGVLVVMVAVLLYVSLGRSADEPAPPPKVAQRVAAPADAAQLASDAPQLSGDAAAAAHPGPDTPIVPPTSGDKRPASPSGEPKRCQCIPSSAPDVFALCAKKGPSLCRCDTAAGASLCPVPVEGLNLTCPDEAYGKYHVPGRADEPCSGFPVPHYEKTAGPRTTGHLECDVCAGAALTSFRGTDGEACTGFYWRTGDAKAGTLAHCE